MAVPGGTERPPRIRVWSIRRDRNGNPLPGGTQVYDHLPTRHGSVPLMAPADPDGYDRIWVWDRIRRASLPWQGESRDLLADRPDRPGPAGGRRCRPRRRLARRGGARVRPGALAAPRPHVGPRRVEPSMTAAAPSPTAVGSPSGWCCSSWSPPVSCSAGSTSHVMPSERTPEALPFDLRNPMLDARLGECVQVESTSDAGRRRLPEGARARRRAATPERAARARHLPRAARGPALSRDGPPIPAARGELRGGRARCARRSSSSTSTRSACRTAWT